MSPDPKAPGEVLQGEAIMRGALGAAPFETVGVFEEYQVAPPQPPVSATNALIALGIFTLAVAAAAIISSRSPRRR